MSRVRKGPGTGRVSVRRLEPKEIPKNLRRRSFTNPQVALEDSRRLSRAAEGQAQALSRTRRHSAAAWALKSTQFVTVPLTASTTLHTFAVPLLLFFVKVASAAVVKSKRQAPCRGHVRPSAVPNLSCPKGF